MNLSDYSKIIVSFSGGKDSIWCVLHLLELGVPKHKIELWHNCVDGKSNSFMDWPVTESYCQAFAEIFGIRIFFSWKDGGFEREMTRKDQPTATNYFQVPHGPGGTWTKTESSGGNGPNNTREKFPQVTADLRTRWCSAYLKIDVFASALRNQERFNKTKTLVVTGERAEESPGRAKYKVFESDRTDARNGKKKRHVDHWRPAHKILEPEIWALIEKHRVNPHPAYHMGWGRLSCMTCIFGSDNQWSSVNNIDPERIKKQVAYEDQFKTTIHRSKSIYERVQAGEPYEDITHELKTLAMSKNYTDSIIHHNWTLPAGAFGEDNGPV
jgi:3'-phosphoadenosine 5'-phosphosulfate sulfotransferase (PAPS reductase)/FAD synthetase